jgi:hypothetical protein
VSSAEVIAALVANRLCAQAPLHDIAGWASSAVMAELLSVPAGLPNDDRLGRALEAPAARGNCALADVPPQGIDVEHRDLGDIVVRVAYRVGARRVVVQDLQVEPVWPPVLVAATLHAVLGVTVRDWATSPMRLGVGFCDGWVFPWYGMTASRRLAGSRSRV